MELTTTYLGLKLSHPLMAGASPLADDLDKVKRLEDAGAAAIVMHSLFEEQIADELNRAMLDVETPEESFPEALTYYPKREDYRFGPEEYLEQIGKIKKAVSIPVIGSLNGITAGGWMDYGRRIEEAGADALELNLYQVSADTEETGQAVEERLLAVVRSVKQAVGIPVAVKLSPFFSSLPNFAKGLDSAGVDGLVLFNRFYQPDIDVDDLEVVPRLKLSDPSELLLRLRWLAILSGRVKASLAVTGGVHSGEDAVKAVMAGAHGVQVVSALLKNGPAHLAGIREEMVGWMEAHEYESVAQMCGSMSLRTSPDPGAFERGNYMRILQGRRS